MSWFYLALLGPLLYAVVNLLDDNLLHYVYKSPSLATAAAGLFGALPLLTLLFVPAPAITIKLAMLAGLAGVLFTAYAYYYFRGLQSDMPSVVIALFCLAPATLPLLARIFVQERLLPLEILGFVVVLVGSLGLAVTDIQKFKFSKVLGLVIIGVIFANAAALSTKYVYQRSAFYPAYLAYAAGMGLGGLGCLWLGFRQNITILKALKPRLGRLLPVFVITELLALAAEFSLNLAISRGPVSLVSVIESVQPMFVLLIAIGLYPIAPRYFREAKAGRLRRKFSLMAVILVGLALISFAAKP